MTKSLNVWVVVGALGLLCIGAGCGSDDSGGGSGGSGTGGSGTGGGGTGGSGTGGGGTGGSSGGMAGTSSGGTSSGGMAGSSTGGTGTGGASDGGGTHQTCTDAGAKMKAMAAKFTCTDNSAAIQSGCEALYAGNKCVTEWETMIACALALPESVWECGGKGTPDFKAGNCTSQKAAFDACVAK